jgi:serine/threonine-protein kinase
MIGTTIAGYRIIEKLGEGGMGVVYKAVDLSLDRVVALKALNAELAKNPELEQRFRAEAKAQASLNHVNLATLYAFLVESGMAWMVMEFIEGESFAGMIQRRGPIPSEETLPLFRQALLGLGYAHRMGIVHRDIKPGNIMLNRQGIVKVMDFGIAKVLGGRSMTRTGTQMGTAWYMAPEQVVNRGVDIRSDIYALGVTLYEMLSGRVPFDSDSDYQVMSDHVNTPPPPPTQFYPYIPRGVVNAVLKALAKDPNERFQTTEDFGAALENPESFAWAPAAAMAAGAGAAATAQMSQPMPPAPQPAAVVPPSPPPKAGFAWTLPRLAAIGLAVVVLAGAGVYLKLHPPFHPKPAIGKLLPRPISPGDNGSGGGNRNDIQIVIPPAQPPAPSPDSNQESQNGGTGERKPGVQKPSPQRQQQQQPGQQQQQQEQQQGQQQQRQDQQQPSPAPIRSAQAIPAGTTIAIRTTTAIDSGSSYAGQKFAASVDAPVVVLGSVVVPRGANAQLEVVVAADSGHLRGRPVLELRMVALAVHGQLVTVETDSFLREGTSRTGTTGAVVGGAAAVGGVIGGVFHRKRGAAEGAAAGAGAGTVVEEGGRNRVQIPSESRIEFHLRAPVPVL